MRKSRNMNKAKWVSNFLICCANNVVEHYGKRKRKSCTGVLLRADLRGWSSQPKWVEWPCPVRSTLKRTPVQDFNSFPIMFYCTISTTYQETGDLF